MCFPGITFTIDSSDDGAGDPCWPGVGGGGPLKWSLQSFPISGRACEPLGTRGPRGGVVYCRQRPLGTRKAVWGGLGTVAALRLCVRGRLGGGGGGGGGGEMATGSVTGSHASGTCKRGEEKSDTKASYKGTDPTTAGRKANL